MDGLLMMPLIPTVIIMGGNEHVVIVEGEE